MILLRIIIILFVARRIKSTTLLTFYVINQYLYMNIYTVVESYFVFAVGNLGPLWNYLYPTCTPTKDSSCADAKSAIPFIQVAAIIFAQLTFGFLSDILGRRWGSRLTASLMLVGGILITISYGVTIAGQFVMMCIALFIFCLGVGGEYPLSSSSSAERSEQEGLRRGRTVTLVFAHQGWGSVVNTMILTFLLAVTGTGGCTKAYASSNSTATVAHYCSAEGMEITWRVSYAFGTLVLIGLMVYRFWCMKETQLFKSRRSLYDSLRVPNNVNNNNTTTTNGTSSSGNLDTLAAVPTPLQQQPKSERSMRMKNFTLLFTNKHYLSRLFGAGFSWFVWDVAF
jgi:MFS family permease